MKLAQTMVPTFDVAEFAKEAVSVTELPPNESGTWPVDMDLERALASQTVPEFDFEELAAEAARVTVVPPLGMHTHWALLRDTLVPVWAVSPADSRAQDIDIRAAFVLLHVDGVSTLRDIVAESAIPRDEVLAIFAHLAGTGVIWLRGDTEMQPPSASPSSEIRWANRSEEA